MTPQKENTALQVGTERSLRPQPVKLPCLPQASILWLAYQQCRATLEADPTPINLIIAQVLGLQWHEADLRESTYDGSNHAG
jgi:hypothetical protein